MNDATPRKKVFMYCRKSSEGEDKQMLSIPSQVKELKVIAEKLNLRIVDTFEESKLELRFIDSLVDDCQRNSKIVKKINYKISKYIQTKLIN